MAVAKAESRIKYPVPGEVQVCKTVDEAMRQLIVSEDHCVKPFSYLRYSPGETNSGETEDDVISDLEDRRKTFEKYLSETGQVKVGPMEKLRF